MRVVAAVLFLLAVFSGSAFAEDQPQGITTKDKAAIRDAISRQIAAFRRDDADAAFGLASPGIRATFGDAGRFIAMVRESYQAVYRPREVEFRDLLVQGGRFVQPVLVVGPDGVAKLALYPMERQRDGLWLIDGCYLIAAPDEAT